MDFVLLGTPIWVKGKLSRSHATGKRQRLPCLSGAWKQDLGQGKARTPWPFWAYCLDLNPVGREPLRKDLQGPLFTQAGKRSSQEVMQESLLQGKEALLSLEEKAARAPRGNPACRGTFGGRRKAVRDRLALQGGTGDFP